MKWAAVAVVSAALLAGGCGDTFVQGDVIENTPGGSYCAKNAGTKGGRTTHLKIQSSAHHVDPNDPNYTWTPTIHDICVTVDAGASHPVGSRWTS